MNELLQKEEKLKYLLVTDPYTGQEVNILPIFEFCNRAWYMQNSPKEITIILDNVIRFIATNVQNDTNLKTVKEVFYDLYSLKDVFERIATPKSGNEFS